MKKTFLLLAVLLSGSLFAQEKTFQSGKGHNCMSISRGCLNTGNNSIIFNIEKSQENIVVFSISTVGLSEEDQLFLIGDKLANMEEENFFSQEEDYYFSEEEKTILNLNGNALLSKGKYPVKAIDNKLYLELEVSYN